jgi:hypothetical protein
MAIGTRLVRLLGSPETTGGMRRRDMRKRFFALATMAALFAIAVPAQATVQDHEHYSDAFSDDFEACGFSLHLEGVASGNARNRVGKGDLDTAYFGLDNYEFTVKITNTANGRFFTEWGNGILRDVSATHVSGSIFQFTTVESGRPYNLSDASGNVLLRDRGSIRDTYLFDTQGDHTPGGEFLELIEERVSGPHPRFFMSDDEFCAFVTPLLS